MAHIIEGKDLAVFIQTEEAFIQVIGINLAKLLKPKIPKNKNKPIIKTMKEVKNYQKTRHKQKSDVLSKLPGINRVKMLYNSLIRNKFALPAKNFLNLKPGPAGEKIANRILGSRSKKNIFRNFQ